MTQARTALLLACGCNGGGYEPLVHNGMKMRVRVPSLALVSKTWYNVTMNKFKLSVELVVEVEAFDRFDAEEAVRDAFGLGDVYGIEIVESEVSSE